MAKKSNAANAAQVENVVKAEQAVIENAQVVETSPIEEKAMRAKKEAEKLMARAKAAAEAAKYAAKEAKEAAKKAKVYTSRPVRKSYFEAYIESDEFTLIGKGDVHYCVEKSAIDEAVRQREMDEELQTVCIYKVSKAEPEKDRTLISKVYIDPETKQVVIE